MISQVQKEYGVERVRFSDKQEAELVALLMHEDVDCSLEALQQFCNEQNPEEMIGLDRFFSSAKELISSIEPKHFDVEIESGA